MNNTNQWLTAEVSFKLLGIYFLELAYSAILSSRELAAAAEPSNYLKMITSCFMKLSDKGYVFRFYEDGIFYFVEHCIKDNISLLRVTSKNSNGM